MRESKVLELVNLIFLKMKKKKESKAFELINLIFLKMREKGFKALELMKESKNENERI